MEQYSKKLSIIIPVYNVEKYIRDCLLSIFKQGLKNSEFEVVFVNDGTLDNSIGVIDDIISQYDNIIVINQENKGVSMARNAGLDKSRGKFVYFMDPDDLLVDNVLSVLLYRLESSSADILMADYSRFNDGDDFTPLLNVEQHYNQCLKSGEQAFLEDLNPYECYIWLMLIRRDFLIENKINFKSFWYEDTLFCQECFLKAKSVLITNCQLYVYRLWAGSFTSSMNLGKMLDLNSCLSALLGLRDELCLSRNVGNKLLDNIFVSFSYGLWCIVHNDRLYSQRREIVSDLKNKVFPPSFVFSGNLKQRAVSFMFRYFPYFYLRLRRLC